MYTFINSALRASRVAQGGYAAVGSYKKRAYADAFIESAVAGEGLYHLGSDNKRVKHTQVANQMFDDRQKIQRQHQAHGRPPKEPINARNSKYVRKYSSAPRSVSV